MKNFLTRVDLSNDRQIQQKENTLTTFSGSLNTLQYSVLGQDYSDLKKGVDESTSGVIDQNVGLSLVFNFTGTTGSTTYFGITSQYTSIIPNLPIITDTNYTENFTANFFNATQSATTDGNVFAINFSGYEFNFDVIIFNTLGLSGNTFSGICSTNYIYTLSARTYDWYYLQNGSTTWLDVLGRINTKKLTVESIEVPTTSGSTGITGTITWDSSYLYVCIATNTWKRTPLSTW